MFSVIIFLRVLRRLALTCRTLLKMLALNCSLLSFCFFLWFSFFSVLSVHDAYHKRRGERGETKGKGAPEGKGQTCRLVKLTAPLLFLVFLAFFSLSSLHRPFACAGAGLDVPVRLPGGPDELRREVADRASKKATSEQGAKKQ